jgi:CO/xanthine dehydrogenase Mo-binding subunit
MNAPFPHSAGRRRFLKQGAGLTVGFSLAANPTAFAQQAAAPKPAPLPGSLQTNRMLSGWLRVNADGSVTMMTGKIELGQGITTALCQIVSDELDIDYKRIKVISGDTALTPNEGVTSGSLSIQDSGTALRFASAEARDILLQAASARLGVPADQLKVEDGTISGPGGRTTYWELANDALLKREATAKARPKPVSGHKLIGKNVQRRDIPPKVTGGEAYVQDMRLPGMLYGRVVRPPSPRATLISADLAAIRRMPGVVAVMRDGNFLALAAQREEQAIAAREALRKNAKWEEKGDLPPPAPALYEHMKTQRMLDTVVSSKTDASAAASGAKTVNVQYTRPFQAHGSIGPSCAVAQFKGGKMQVWSHTQGVFPLRGDLAKMLRMPESDIIVSHREGSGCYGQNGADDVAADVALLARAPELKGRPVKLQWMREDEFGWEPFGSAMVIAMKASLDAGGKVVDWNHELWSHAHSTRPYDPDGCNLIASWYMADPLKPGPSRNIPQPSGGSDRNAVPLYEFPQQKVTNHLLLDMPLRTSALRTLGAYANVFALESFMDELALAAGTDPMEFRLKHLADPRAKAVIESVMAKANYQPGRQGDGSKGRGVAFSKYKNLAVYVAVVVDVEVDRASGNVRVTHAWAAADAGMIVNPDGIKNQIEGGMIQSASWTLHESLPFDQKGVKAHTWADYPILRFPEVPVIDVTLINRPEERPLGVGEGSQGPMVAAIANAIANATGKRIRELPFTPERVKAALA